MLHFNKQRKQREIKFKPNTCSIKRQFHKRVLLVKAAQLYDCFLKELRWNRRFFHDHQRVLKWHVSKSVLYFPRALSQETLLGLNDIMSVILVENEENYRRYHISTIIVCLNFFFMTPPSVAG